LVLRDGVGKPKGGSAWMGGECRNVSLLHGNGREAMVTREKLARPEITNPTWPRVAANPTQLGMTNPTQHRGVAKPTRPRVADSMQPGAAILAQPRAVNLTCLGGMVNPVESRFSGRDQNGPAPRFCMRGLSKMHHQMLQKMRQKEIVVQKEEGEQDH
jgi:hypothetical protein